MKTKQETPRSLADHTATRRGVLLGLGAGAVAYLTGCMSNGEEGQGDVEHQRGQQADPPASPPASPTTKTSETPPARSPPPETSQSASVSPSPTVERDVPALQNRLPVTWRTVVNPVLAARVRAAGVAAKGDPSMAGVEDPKYWDRGIVVGMPVGGLKGEDRLSVMTVTSSQGDEGGDTVRYAYLPIRELASPVQGDGDGGPRRKVHPLRVPVGEDPRVVGFATGIVNDAKVNPTWKAQDTELINPGIALEHPSYQNAPVVVPG